jgi:alcohol dehydrogenase class IV
MIQIYNPDKLVFGPKSIDQMVEDYILMGKKRIFILSIPPVLDLIQDKIDKLISQNINVEVNTDIKAEPTFSEFEQILDKAKDFGPDSVAGIGGGSVLDMAKIIAVFINYNKKLEDCVGIGRIEMRSTHLVCVPTTSGTGSEVSPNSILLDDKNGGKKGFISPYLVPDIAYVDPELTLGLPPQVTAYTGLDAMTHCIEAYANKFAHPLIDTYALKGISLIFNNLLTVVNNGSDLDARTYVSMGSLFGGYCLGPVNTGAVHALAYPLGSDYKLAHGLTNALLLPYVLEFNLKSAPDRYASIARAIGINDDGPDEEIAKKGIEKLKELISLCNIPLKMKDLGISENSLGEMASSAVTIERLLKNNVREVVYEDALMIYKNAF